MAITTDEYWSVNDVPLNTYAYNIETWGGSRQGVPPVRGSDFMVPNRRGRIWMPKALDSRSVSFGMWVLGADEDGRVPLDGQSQKKFRQNFLMLKKLLWTNGREQVRLTKRFWDDTTDSEVPIEATAMAEFSGGLLPQMTGDSRAIFTVDYFLADPFFHGIQSEIKLTRFDNEVEAIFVGDEPTDDIEIEIIGGLNNLVLSVEGQGSLSVPNIPSGDRVVIDVSNYKATYYSSGGLVYSISGQIASTFGLDWFRLPIGLGKITLAASSGSGKVLFRHRPLWL